MGSLQSFVCLENIHVYRLLRRSQNSGQQFQHPLLFLLICASISVSRYCAISSPLLARYSLADADSRSDAVSTAECNASVCCASVSFPSTATFLRVST